MLSSTRKDYKENYEGRLSVHKKSYFENDETSFLELELTNYTKYYNSLIKISDFFKNKTHKDLRVNSAITDVISDLKKINEPVFNEIFTIEKTKVEIDKVELDNGYVDEMIRGFIPGRVKIDFEKLKNRVTSAKRILDFIGQQLTILLSPNKNATSIYKKGELPLKDIDQRSAVPGETTQTDESANPYPRIFVTSNAYLVFKNLKAVFKDTKQNIANYSFVYHKMVHDNLIYPDIKQREYLEMLGKFDISIARLKSPRELGKNSLKESIYSNAK